jgi:hypothetical protein
MEAKMVASDVWDRLKRSNRLAEKRIHRAVTTLGDDVVDRLMIFALHLLGGQAESIAAAVDKPVDSVNGMIQRVYKEGLPALEDRRQRASTFRPVVASAALPEPVRLSVAPDLVSVAVGRRQLLLPRSDPLLCRSVLLCLLEGGWVGLTQTAAALELSAERVRKLRTQLQQRGASSLVDQRTGQAQEYRMAPATKAELIWQYVVNLEGGRAVSAARLKQDLEQRGESCPSAQTIRLHVKKLGLDHLRKKKRRDKR